VNNFYRNYGKRLLDFLLAIILSILFFWLVIFILLFYIISFQGKPFFRQKRIGKNCIPFTIFKFRTLSDNTNKPLPERRFPLGDFLRFTNLDELPQLFNILIGNMAFIGPRPFPVEYLSLYSPEHQERHTVRPGITGWAQVNGRHSISWQKKFSLDIYYVKNISLLFDIIILFKTILLILSFKKDYSLSEKKFTGNNDA